MPASRVRSTNPQPVRVAPYPPQPPKEIISLLEEEDKENRATSSSVTEPKAPKAKTTTKRQASPDRSGLPAHYLDIELEEKKGEVPVYEDAAMIRRKLNKLIESKATIPGSKKKWTKASISAEMRTIAQKHHPIEGPHGMENQGPSANSVTRFLQKSGSMAGGDTTPYYYGNMLLEKLRIWNNEKKTAGRLNAEKKYPNGRARVNPDNVWQTVGPGLPPMSYNEIAGGR